MRKILKYKYLFISSIIILLVCGVCQSDKSDSNTSVIFNDSQIVSDNNQLQNTIDSNIDTNNVKSVNENHEHEEIVQNDGYTVCKLQDCDKDVLVILSGSDENKRQFDFYFIDNDKLENIGSLDGTDITAYISDDTKSFCIRKITGKDEFLLGTVKYDEGIIIDNVQTVIIEGEHKHFDYPGSVVSFKSTDNGEFKQKYAEKIALEEDFSEIEE